MSSPGREKEKEVTMKNLPNYYYTLGGLLEDMEADRKEFPAAAQCLLDVRTSWINKLLSQLADNGLY